MSGYFENYSKEIFEGLLKGVTTRNGMDPLDKSTALEQWVDKAEEIRTAKGLFFFCGN